MTQANTSSTPAQAIDSHLIPITFFDDKFAAVKYEDALTLPDLADEILRMTDRAKKKLPWLKLARFGDMLTANNSLRSNANVVCITGVEVDYDSGETTFDQALERLEAAGLRALVYTSASHQPGVKEKWRVLCPASQPLPPEARHGLAAVLHGVLGPGIDGSASFTLSTAFYYGSVNSSPDHRVEVLDGDFIDLRVDLVAGAVGKPPRAAPDGTVNSGELNERSAPGGAPGYSDADIDAMLDKSQFKNSDGSGNWWDNMLAVIGSLVGRGLGDEAILARVMPFAYEDVNVRKFIDSARKKWNIPDPDIEAGSLLGDDVLAAIAKDAPAAPAVEKIRPMQLDDFQAFLPTHHVVHMPTRKMWPVSSVDDGVPAIQLFKPDGTAVKNAKNKPVYIKPSVWLAQNRPLELMTWMPGEPEIIRDRLVMEGGWVDRPGARVLNMYLPPRPLAGDATLAGRWIEHVEKLYGDDAMHLIKWLAFKVQYPGVKINHMVVMGGAPGIGKDTLLEPVKQAVGPWNVAEISPKDMLERFNGYAQSVILRISEARDLGDMSRYEFYERTKVYGAAPPDVLMVDEKNLRRYAIPNVCGTLITTNYKTNGIYLPADDRRHFVAWSDVTKDAFPAGYWPGLWAWYEAGGIGHVAAYLSSINLSDFNPKAPPPLTAAFHDIVAANMAPEDAEMADAIDRLGRPEALTVEQLRGGNSYEFTQWLREPKNRRTLPFRMEQCGYARVTNPTSKQGLWVVGGVRQIIYAKADLSLRDRSAAASKLVLDAAERSAGAGDFTEGVKKGKG